MKVLDTLKGAEICVAKILCISPAYGRDDAIEFMYQDANGKPWTVWVDPDGKVVKGPFKGIGHDDKVD